MAVIAWPFPRISHPRKDGGLYYGHLLSVMSFRCGRRNHSKHLTLTLSCSRITSRRAGVRRPVPMILCVANGSTWSVYFNVRHHYRPIHRFFYQLPNELSLFNSHPWGLGLITEGKRGYGRQGKGPATVINWRGYSKALEFASAYCGWLGLLRIILLLSMPPTMWLPRNTIKYPQKF